MAADFLYGLMNNRKSMKDFAREEEAFEAAKRARKMAEEGAMLDLEQKKYDLEQAKSPQQPFKGSSWDAQAANVAYQRRLAEGLDPMTAEQMAVDDVLRSKVTFTKDAENNTIAIPRSPMFGGGSPAPNQVSDYETPPFVEAPTMGTGGNDPLAAHRAANEQRVAQMGGNQYRTPPDAPLFPDMNQDDVEAVIGNQGDPMPRPATGGQEAYTDEQRFYDLIRNTSGVNVPPDTKSGVYQKQKAIDVAADTAKAANDPKFLAERKDAEEKKARSEAYKNQKRQTASDDALMALNILKNEKSAYPKTGVVGQIMSLEGSTSAGQLQALVDSIQSPVALEAIQAGRENSPTGGFLGNTSDKDIKLVKDSMGNLTLNQRPEFLERSLQRVYNAQMDAMHGTPEQVRAIGGKLGLPQEEIDRLSYRFPIKNVTPRDVMEPNTAQQSGWSIRKLD